MYHYILGMIVLLPALFWLELLAGCFKESKSLREQPAEHWKKIEQSLCC